jgi:hypothetical protein
MITGFFCTFTHLTELVDKRPGKDANFEANLLLCDNACHQNVIRIPANVHIIYVYNAARTEWSVFRSHLPHMTDGILEVCAAASCSLQYSWWHARIQISDIRESIIDCTCCGHIILCVLDQVDLILFLPLEEDSRKTTTAVCTEEHQCNT